MREKSDDEGAGVAVAVEGVGGCRGGTETGEALVAAAAAVLAVAAVLADFASSHCPGEPRSGEPTSSGGSAERDGGAAPDGGGEGPALGSAGVVVLWAARRWGRSRLLSRGIVFRCDGMNGWVDG